MNPSTLRSCLSRAKKGSSNPKKYKKTNPTKPVSYKSDIQKYPMVIMHLDVSSASLIDDKLIN